MCKCSEKIPSWKELIHELIDEMIELIENPRDKKEWSDVGRGMERIVEKMFKVKVNLGGGMNRRIQIEREEKWGCIRSWEKVNRNGGRCLSS
jgi:hypothetical protein